MKDRSTVLRTMATALIDKQTPEAIKAYAINCMADHNKILFKDLSDADLLKKYDAILAMHKPHT